MVAEDDQNGNARLPDIHVKSAVELQRSQRRLELESRFHQMHKQEGALRATLLGYEYESRYRLLWAYQRESERLRVGALEASQVAAAWQQSKYLESVRAFQRWGEVWSTETNAREELVREEAEGWEGVWGWHAMELLSIEHKKLQAERAAAMERLEAMDSVRQFELEVQLSALRSSSQYYPKPPTEMVSATIITGKPTDLELKSKKKRVEYLMDYTVNEEEFQHRQGLRREEELARVALVAEREKTIDVPLEEMRERFELYDIFYHGCHEGRLQRILKIQRWWRMLRSAPWSSHSRAALRSELRSYRSAEQPSSYYRRKLELMVKNKREPSEEKQMHWQTLAAKRLHQTAMDEYVISLQRLWETFVIQQEHRYQVAIDRCLQTKLDAASAITLVASESDEEWKARRGYQHYLQWLQSHSELPLRFFTRHPPPYEAWRDGRWDRYSTQTLQRIEDCHAEEAAAREASEADWEHGNSELALWASVLASGDEEAVKALQLLIGEVEQMESEDRHQILQSECTEWSDIVMVKAAWDEQHVQPAMALWAQMLRARRVIWKEEEAALVALGETHWRWSSLASARARIAAGYPSRAVWNISCRSDCAKAFRSLDAVANLIRRFFYRYVHRKPAVVLGGDDEQTEELLLQLRAAKAAHRLECLYKERTAALKLSAQARAREKKANEEVNGSGGALFTQERIPGFSCVPRWVAAAEQAAKGEEEDDVSRVGPWIYFRRWMVSNMESERDWREVLARFQSQNREFYNNFAFLLSLMREGRERIEREETAVRYRLRFRQGYRDWVSHLMYMKERRERKLCVAAEEDARFHMMQDLRTLKTAVHWGREEKPLYRRATQRPHYLAVQRALVRHVKPEESSLLVAARRAYMNIPHVQHPRHPEDILLYHHNGPTLRQILSGQLLPDGDAVRTATRALIDASTAERQPAVPLPRLSRVQRLMAREEVRRAAVEVQRRKELAGFFLEGFAAPFRAAIEEEEVARCRRVCIRVDSKFPSHPLVACGRLLMAEEAVARAALEKEAWEGYQLPLLASHHQYLYRWLAMNFTLGHWTMTSHAQYMDKRLMALLTQRVGHLQEKLDDLVDQEAASRTRLEYMEEVDADMRFLWKKG